MIASPPLDLPAFVPADRRYTVAEWLAIEEATGERYEYHAGTLVSARAMAGGSPEHALLIGNASYLAGGIVRELEREGLRETRCSVYSSDLKLAVLSEERYVYPDLAIVCGKPVFDEAVPTAVVNPVAVFEVLSPSSRDYDEGEKFRHYGALTSLRNYVLVRQRERRVDLYTRPSADGEWSVTVHTRVGDAFALGGLGGLPIGLDDLYRDWDVRPPSR